jgi:hypothetical protein
MPRTPTHRPNIVAAIQAAGAAGITAKEVAAQVGCTPQQSYKDIKGLEQAGELERKGKSGTGGDLLIWTGGHASSTLDNRSTGGLGVSLQTRPPGTGTGSISCVRLGQAWTVVGMSLEDGLTRVSLRDATGETLEFTVPS